MSPLPDHAAWLDDPLEVDRYLDGECDAAETERRRRDLAGQPERAARIEARLSFLAGLSAAGAARRAQLRARMPEGLESRVRFALRRQRGRSGPARWVAAAAAVLVAALAASFLGDRTDEASAMPPEVIKAVAAARASAEGPRACEVQAERGPMQFPPVKEGALRIWRCRDEGRRTIAKLYRPEDLPSIGYAAVAEEGVERGPDLGRTDLGDMVVFDVAYGRRRHYLAVSQVWLDEAEARHPGRSSCRACHNRSREGQPNPHNIVQRSWRPGG